MIQSLPALHWSHRGRAASLTCHHFLKILWGCTSLLLGSKTELIPSAPPSVQTYSKTQRLRLLLLRGCGWKLCCPVLCNEPNSQQGTNISNAAVSGSTVPNPQPVCSPSLISSCPGSAQPPCTCAHEASCKHMARSAGTLLKMGRSEGPDVN